MSVSSICRGLFERCHGGQTICWPWPIYCSKFTPNLDGRLAVIFHPDLSFHLWSFHLRIRRTRTPHPISWSYRNFNYSYQFPRGSSCINSERTDDPDDNVRPKPEVCPTYSSKQFVGYRLKAAASLRAILYRRASFWKAVFCLEYPIIRNLSFYYYHYHNHYSEMFEFLKLWTNATQPYEWPSYVFLYLIASGVWDMYNLTYLLDGGYIYDNMYKQYYMYMCSSEKDRNSHCFGHFRERFLLLFTKFALWVC